MTPPRWLLVATLIYFAALAGIWLLVWTVGKTCAVGSRVRVWLAVRGRPAWIPAAPAPMKRWKPRRRRRISNRQVKARLRRLGAELEAEYGGDFAYTLGLLAKNDHADH